MSDDNPNQPLTKADGSSEFEPAGMIVGYDNYRSLQDFNLLIFVEHDAVPPFRFRAGGWELLQSSIELGSAMKARIAENGFFMWRVNEDKNGGVEFSDPQIPLVKMGLGESMNKATALDHAQPPLVHLRDDHDVPQCQH